MFSFLISFCSVKTLAFAQNGFKLRHVEMKMLEKTSILLSRAFWETILDSEHE